MTGWRCDKETMAFVDEIKASIDARPDLMPDAWYWLSMHVEDDLCLNDVSQEIWLEDAGFVAWLRTNPEQLARHLASHKKLRQAYADRVVELDKVIELLK